VRLRKTVSLRRTATITRSLHRGVTSWRRDRARNQHPARVYVDSAVSVVRVGHRRTCIKRSIAAKPYRCAEAGACARGSTTTGEVRRVAVRRHRSGAEIGSRPSFGAVVWAEPSSAYAGSMRIWLDLPDGFVEQLAEKGARICRDPRSSKNSMSADSGSGQDVALVRIGMAAHSISDADPLLERPSVPRSARRLGSRQPTS
jgi:hypothetical protein